MFNLVIIYNFQAQGKNVKSVFLFKINILQINSFCRAQENLVNVLKEKISLNK